MVHIFAVDLIAEDMKQLRPTMQKGTIKNARYLWRIWNWIWHEDDGGYMFIGSKNIIQFHIYLNDKKLQCVDKKCMFY